MWATVHYFVQNILVFDMQKKNFAVTQQSPGKYCNCGGFKSVSSKNNEW